MLPETEARFLIDAASLDVPKSLVSVPVFVRLEDHLQKVGCLEVVRIALLVKSPLSGWGCVFFLPNGLFTAYTWGLITY